MSDSLGPFLITVDDEFGRASLIVDYEVTDHERAVLDPLIAASFPRIDDQALLAACIVRLRVDDKAYERVCRVRGLLL